MATLDLESEYNNSRRVPEFPQIAQRWRDASDAYRRTAVADLDQRYGERPRQRYDVYHADREDAPTVVYLHGGYWQGGDRGLYGFVAQALTAAGLRTVIPSYSLCPAVGVLDIVDEIRRFIAVWWERTGVEPLLVGHSAGGHLAAAMLATDWTAVVGAPDDAVTAAVCISGIFALEPLVPTTINAALGLDRATARAVSPCLWPSPPPGRTLLAVVGEQEGAEFHRQSRELVAAWSAAGTIARCWEAPGANHFTVVEQLTDPAAPLHSAVRERAAAVSARRSSP